MSVQNANNAGGQGDRISDPDPENQSQMHDIELRQIIDVARSYVDAGQYVEARDVLQEAIDAGLDTQVVTDLAHQIEVEERKKNGTEPASDTNDMIRPDHKKPLLHLTAPLPRFDALTRSVQRLVAETEREFFQGRWQSAFDLCNLVIAQAPDYTPNYLRNAQLRIALGDIDGAMGLIESVNDVYQLDEVEDDPVLRAINVSLNPDNTSLLVEHAQYLLTQPIISTNDPFIPAAIDATMVSDPATARDLALTLVEQRPADADSIRTLIRATLEVSGPETIRQTLVTHVKPETRAIDLLWWRTATAIANQEPDWPEWLSNTVRQAHTGDEQFELVRGAIACSRTYFPERIVRLGSAIIEVAAGEIEAAYQAIEDWKHADCTDGSGLEHFVGACAQMELAEARGDEDILPILEQQIAAVASMFPNMLTSGLGIFSTPTTRQQILNRYCEIVESADANDRSTEFLKSLVLEYPQDPGIRMIFAQQLIARGELSTGVRELQEVTRTHERSGNLLGMTEAMQTISKAVPEDINVKQTIIDTYMRRGIIDQALPEYQSLAALKLSANDTEGAIQAYTKAADIASAMGKLSLGHQLYDRGVEADPDNVPIRHAAIAFYLQTGSVNRATEHLREVVRIAIDENDPDEAVAALHQIIGLAPDDLDSYHKLGEVLTSMGEYKQAERVYRRLSDISPDDPVLRAKQSALAVLASTI